MNERFGATEGRAKTVAAFWGRLKATIITALCAVCFWLFVEACFPSWVAEVLVLVSVLSVIKNRRHAAPNYSSNQLKSSKASPTLNRIH
jgi:fatty acid desaturase